MAIINSNQKLTPCLWFDNNAEEAVKFYSKIFKNFKKGTVTYYGKGAPLPEGTLLTVYFQIEKQNFLALNGGPYFKFTEAISFVVNCKTQKEVDHYWEKLSEGGIKSQCGWLKDKFGVSWQITPTILIDMVADKKDPEKAGRAWQAMMKMKKIDIAALKKAYDGKK